MLDSVMKGIQEDLDKEDAIREKILPEVRKIIRNSGSAIRATHKGEFEKAKELNDESYKIIVSFEEMQKSYPLIYYKNYVIDAQQEFCESQVFYSLVKKENIEKITPKSLNILNISYLLGLADVIGELRRYTLDSIREEKIEKAEEALENMTDIYENLISFDYPSGLTPGLRKKCDVARGIIERTRGDLTMSLQLYKFTKKLK